MLMTYMRLEDMIRDIDSHQVVDIGIMTLPARKAYRAKPRRYLVVTVKAHCYWHLDLSTDQNRSDRLIRIMTTYLRHLHPNGPIRNATPQFSRPQIERLLEIPFKQPDNLVTLNWTDQQGKAISHIAYMTAHEASLLALYEHPKAGRDAEEHPIMQLRLQYDAWDRCLERITHGDDEWLAAVEDIRPQANHEKMDYERRLSLLLRQTTAVR